MKTRLGLTLTAVAIFTGGCASVPQAPVSLSHDAIGSQAGRIGVAMTALPKVDTQFPGASCLLCMGAAALANSSLTSYTQKLSYEDLPKLKQEVANLLRKKNADVTVIDEELNVKALDDFGTKGPNIALKDFSPLKKKYKIDKLVVIDITGLGFIRTYSAYIPTSDPKGLLQGTGYVVNLTNNTYDWYSPVNVTKSADQSWDEPPKFPGLTNAYFQALEIGKDSFLQPFASDAVAAVAPAASLGSPTPDAATAPSAQTAH
jgi:hypothetical protein